MAKTSHNDHDGMPQRLWALIRQVDEFKGNWIGGAQLNPQLLGRLKRSVLVTSSGASTRIEGAKLTDDEVEQLMRGLSPHSFQDRDEQEVRGYFELLQNVFEAWQSITFSESAIKHLHRELLKYVDKDERHRGDYKKTENNVEAFGPDGESLGVVFKTTPAFLTPKKMTELVERTRTALTDATRHPILEISKFIVEFLAIHPFQDGNGRLSRVLTNLLMLQAGYSYVPYVSHEKLVEDNKDGYYLALRRSQATLETKRVDLTPWHEFFLTIAVAQARQAAAFLSKENVERLLSPKQLAVWRHIEGAAEASPREIAATTGVTPATVAQALGVLLRLKKIERLGLGRATRYRKM